MKQYMAAKDPQGKTKLYALRETILGEETIFIHDEIPDEDVQELEPDFEIDFTDGTVVDEPTMKSVSWLEEPDGAVGLLGVRDFVMTVNGCVWWPSCEVILAYQKDAEEWQIDVEDGLAFGSVSEDGAIKWSEAGEGSHIHAVCDFLEQPNECARRAWVIRFTETDDADPVIPVSAIRWAEPPEPVSRVWIEGVLDVCTQVGLEWRPQLPYVLQHLEDGWYFEVQNDAEGAEGFVDPKDGNLNGETSGENYLEAIWDFLLMPEESAKIIAAIQKAETLPDS